MKQDSPMRNLLLSAVLIAVPVAGFTAVEMHIQPSVASTTNDLPKSHGLGDMSAYETIVTDTQKIAAGGNLAAAEKRITDFETLWDANAAKLRKVGPVAWGAIDGAADSAFSALRASTPDAANVTKSLSSLLDALKTPAQASAPVAVTLVAGIPVTDSAGHAIPCESMIGDLGKHIGNNAPSAKVSELKSKALERCNADDDSRADAFAAQAISLINKGG